MLGKLPQDLNQSKGTFSNHCTLGNESRRELKENLFISPKHMPTLWASVFLFSRKKEVE